MTDFDIMAFFHAWAKDGTTSMEVRQSVLSDPATRLFIRAKMTENAC
jgi:hypothetical protein